MSEQAGWLPTGAAELFAALHLPDGVVRATAVVLVPPFGWEAVSSARHLRAWARDLATAGYPCVRFHPPGTGDSAGDALEQDLASWSAALLDVVAHTRAATDCARLAVVALGLGGATALQAVHEGAEVDDLVLWATPVKGRLLLRELRAFANLTAEPGGSSGPGGPAPLTEQAPDDGVLWVHGYPLGPRAQEQLTAFDAAALDLGRVRRALVLGRGKLPHDARLGAALSAAGVDVLGEHGLGYDELTVEPRLSQPATEVVDRVREWLLDDLGGEGRTPPQPLPLADTDEALATFHQVVAVVTRAPEPVLTAVFLGAGATPRSGPSRLWTECARRWSAWGISSLRLDLSGIGEGPGADSWPGGPEGFYDESYRPQVRAALDEAVRLGLPDRFLLVGLCSGGLWAAQLALEDERVEAVVALNAVSLVWPPPLMVGHTAKYVRSRETWARLVHEPALRKEVAGRARRSAQLAGRRLRGSAAGPVPVSTDEVLTALARSGLTVAVGVSPGEVSEPDLRRHQAGSGVVVRFFEGPPGAHTLAPAGLRQQAEDLLDETAQRALAVLQDSPTR